MAIASLIAPGVCNAQGYTITTVAGGGNALGTGGLAIDAFMDPAGVAVDSSGNFYVTDYALGVVYKVTSSGNISVFAGTLNQSGYSGDGSPAVGAQLYFPAGLALDSTGNLYIADSLNGRIRKVDTSGIITTVAGGGTPSLNSGDGGPATLATLGEPTGVAVDPAGNIYIADFVGNRVRKVLASDGTITTVAGGSQLAVTANIGDGGPATSAFVYAPTGVAVDSAGNLYIADTGNNRIRKVSNGIITTVAGSGSGSYSGDNGPAIQAGLSGPTGVAVDAGGNIYVADAKDLRVRMVTPDGTITTIAGNGQIGSSGDGGPAAQAKLADPYNVAVGLSGSIYVSVQGQNEPNALLDSRVRLLTPAGSPPATPPSIKDKGVISAGAFGQFASVAPGSWIEIYGSNLATNTRGWAGSDFNGVNAPTSLDGTKVTIGGQSAFVDYISPGQVNAQVPTSVSTGPQPVVVSIATGASSAYTITVNAEQPGLLAPASFSAGGKQYVAALFSDGSTYVLPPGAVAGVSSKRAQAGDTITLYGIGFGPVVPDIPAGQIVQQSNALAQSFHLFFGQMEATVSYAGPERGGTLSIQCGGSGCAR